MGHLLAAGGSVTLNFGKDLAKPSSSILIVLAVTLLSVAPSLLILMTGFVRTVIVLGLTRQALGLGTTPPNQVIAGIALFISLLVMAPTLSAVNHDALQPYVAGKMTATQAYRAGEVPIKTWMLKQTGKSELALMNHEAGVKPAKAINSPMDAVIPAFLLTELRTGFIIGFVIFVPFLIIDLVVAAALAAMGIVMLPPVMVSLPFKLLLFVLVNGWTLVAQTLLGSFH